MKRTKQIKAHTGENEKIKVHKANKQQGGEK